VIAAAGPREQGGHQIGRGPDCLDTVLSRDKHDQDDSNDSANHNDG
jgi:hypothetical protein